MRESSLSESENYQDDRDLSAQRISTLADRSRAKLAWMLFFLLIAINTSAIVIMILLLVIPIQANEDRHVTYTYAKDIITLLIASQTGLIGAVLGFYFGSDR